MSTPSEEYSVVSLFSGAGGFDWGFKRTGRYSTRLSCELLPQPAATLAHNLGLRLISPDQLGREISSGDHVAVQGDIAQVDFSKVSFRPDVLIGGPPCQDFSITISRKSDLRPGLNGGRGRLYVEFVRAVMFLQPKLFVFENVPGLLSANEGKAIETISYDLQHLESRRREAIDAGQQVRVPLDPIRNYELIFSDVVNGPDVGVPQTRRRLIIIGIRRDLYDGLSLNQQVALCTELRVHVSGKGSRLARFPLTCIEVLEGQSLLNLQQKYQDTMSKYAEIAYHGDWPQARLWKTSVWDNLKLDDIRHDYFLANNIEDTPETQSDFLRAMDDHERILSDLDWLGIPVGSRSFEDGTNELPRLQPQVTERMRMITPDQNYAFVNDTQWAVPGHEISFIYRRASPLKPAWTVMAYGGGGTYGYHYERDRAQLTLRERARIQTFSDDFVFQSDGIRAQIGEAVPPLLAQRIAEALLNVLKAV